LPSPTINSILQIITTTSNPIHRQSCFLRKRAGDWLQVLSCLDTNRTYLINSESKNLNGSKVYFCSSDRIAVAFALYNDINCIFKRDNTYLVYNSKQTVKMNNYPSQSLSYFRENAQKYIPLLSEGIENYKQLKSQWGEELLRIKEVENIQDVKHLVIQALHYKSLSSCFGSEYTIKLIMKFIENPNDSYFDQLHNMEAIRLATKTFEQTIRRFKYLNKYDVSESDEYIKLFQFDNVSFDSYDLAYGAALFSSLMLVNDILLNEFVIGAINKVIEFTSYDVNVITLYSLLLESSDIITQVGGGGGGNFIKQITAASMKSIGDYLTKCLLIYTTMPDRPTHYKVIHFVKLFEEESYSLSPVELQIVEYITYKKNFISKDLLKYVKWINSLYDPGEEIYKELENFLKRRTLNTRRKPRNKILRNTIRSSAMMVRRKSRRRRFFS
jgi:hypothetical protein